VLVAGGGQQGMFLCITPNRSTWWDLLYQAELKKKKKKVGDRSASSVDRPI
jgi:hypothetical protein